MTKIVSTTRFVHKETVQILAGCPKIYYFHLSASLQTLCQRHLCKYPGQAHAVIGPWLGLNGVIGIWKKEWWWNLGCLLLWHLTTIQCKWECVHMGFRCRNTIQVEEATKWHQFWSVKLTSDRMHECFVHYWHYGMTLMTIIALNTKITFMKALCKVLAIGSGEWRSCQGCTRWRHMCGSFTSQNHLVFQIAGAMSQ